MAKKKQDKTEVEAKRVHEPWVIKPVSRRAQKEWEQASTENPDLMTVERERLLTRPLDRSANPRRTHVLQGKLGERNIGGVKLQQWQHELAGAGRIWYCPDKDARIVWITAVSLSHPKATD